MNWRLLDLALLLRKLEKKIWLDPEFSKKLGYFGSDALRNFRTSGNSLSVFLVQKDLILITRILTAVIGGCEYVQEAEYALFDSSILDGLGVKYVQDEGTTADTEVNKQHLNLVNLTTQQICQLAEKIQAIGTLDRVSKKKIAQSLRDGIKNGTIQPDRLYSKLASSLSL